ncbi:hypothetical protein PbJCM13498_21530 [Prolixibacter bellariivorans]|uniref:TPM domain-containing protein n=1 Tax=Prolixibacter bellariivorans TaxID=314319 RepID=A0A5M4AZH3_9BACT|nr:TPM domain-containing protein [Prolixibacter bellariivorans]GET33290.1 hypothetical protein PbJCM13498_21530 [Prolixibacter bellariivorans]
MKQIKHISTQLKGWLLLLALMVSFSAFAENSDFPARPKPARLVNDLANILPQQKAMMLNEKLAEFARQTSTQITVVTVKDLHGYDKGDYAVRLAEKWGIGQKGKDNGILMLVKPKTSESTGKAFIAVGYGLEGVVPDVVAKQTIIENEMIPWFKKGDYFIGIDRATNVLMGLTKKEFTADQYIQATREQSKRGRGTGGVGAVIFFIILFVIFGRRRRRFGAVGRGPSFLEGLLLMNLLGGSHQGSWNDFSGGGGSFGGGGGFSDFGGFGGGSFGGGGAGGEW